MIIELRHGVDAQVFLPAGKVNNWATIDGERGNLIADRLLRPGSCCMDRLAYGLEDGLDVWREGADVVIDRPGMLRHSANLES
jgi:hypothetical protein